MDPIGPRYAIDTIHRNEGDAEIDRLREALHRASGQLGYLSTVLRLAGKPDNAASALEWSKQASAAALGAMSAPGGSE